jgi:hypothetical protein
MQFVLFCDSLAFPRIFFTSTKKSSKGMNLNGKPGKGIKTKQGPYCRAAFLFSFFIFVVGG